MALKSPLTELLVLTYIWYPMLIIAIFIWFVIVVPLQYVVYLICGAPTRYMLDFDFVPIVRMSGFKVHPDEINRKKPVPAGWHSVRINKSPVAITNVFAALLFFILQAFVN